MADVSPRSKILHEAEKVITGDRNEQYGSAYEVMKRHVDILNALGYRRNRGELLRPYDTAVIQTALKLARLVGNPVYKDNWLDSIGYSAIGWEAIVIDPELHEGEPFIE
jgi:hypothetical protein